MLTYIFIASDGAIYIPRKSLHELHHLMNHLAIRRDEAPLVHVCQGEALTDWEALTAGLPRGGPRLHLLH